MTIKNSVSNDFLSTFVDSINVFDCRLPGVNMEVDEGSAHKSDFFTHWIAEHACFNSFLAILPQNGLRRDCNGIPGHVAQSVTCLVTDAKLTVDPGVVSSIPARSDTFVEIDHEIISTVNLLPSAESFMKGCCQLQAKVCARLLVNCLFKLAQEKSVVR